MSKRLVALAITAATVAGTAQAGSLLGNGRSNQTYKQQVILEEERRRARAVGGYNDPITALTNLFSGELTEKDISPGVNTIYDTPRHGTSLRPLIGRILGHPDGT